MNVMQTIQTENGNRAVDKGKLWVAVTSEITSYPVEDAVVSVSYTGVPDSTLEQLKYTAPVWQRKLNWIHRPWKTV